jgi:hypothetical protein
VVVAVIAVRVMQVAGDEVIDVIAVRDRGMAAARAVHVIFRVTGALMLRRALARIRGVDGDRALVDVVAVHVMEMTVVHVVDVAGVANRLMAAGRAVNVRVLALMRVRGAHAQLPASSVRTRSRPAQESVRGACVRARPRYWKIGGSAIS